MRDANAISLGQSRGGDGIEISGYRLDFLKVTT